MKRQSLIAFDSETNVFHLSNPLISYVMKIEESGVLSHIHFGKKVSNYTDNKKYPRRDRGFSGNVPLHEERAFSKDTLPQEFSGHGSMDYRIPATIITRENGSSLLDLRYETYQIIQGKPKLSGLPQTYILEEQEAQTLCITLKDRDLPIYVDLFYTIYEKRGVIIRSAKYRNQTEQTIWLDKAASFQLDLTNSGRFTEVIALPGAHARERLISRQRITEGVKSFESRRGSSSHQMNNFIALTHTHTTENLGEAIGLQFIYSGNHAFEIEKDQIDQLRIVGGINAYQFQWQLSTDEAFQTPEMILSYSDEGLNGMSHIHHELLRERVARGKHQYEPRPILVNNWEATYFDFTSKKIKALIDEAAALGMEMFVLDDGWFGKRDADTSSLGDWFEYEGKLANGLKGIAEYAHEKGLKFGLWVEPEMISIDSELYRQTPDYLMQEPARTPAASRSQFVLDFTRKEVRDSISQQLRKILDEVPIDYIKWDMNRSLSDVYSAYVENQGEVYHRYVLGLYDLLEELTTAYPDILWEGCSGGGGRFDAGILYYMPQSWTSDNTDAMERIDIQYGTSLGYPISSMGAHVSASPNHQSGRVTDLKTRGDVAMSGVFGYELDLTALDEQEKRIIKEQISTYKEIRQTVQQGKFDRLENPFEQNIAAWQFVSPNKKEIVVFMARRLTSGQPPFHEIRLVGLEEGMYRERKSSLIYSGSELMTMGLYLPDFHGDFQTEVFHFEKIATGKEEENASIN